MAIQTFWRSCRRCTWYEQHIVHRSRNGLYVTCMGCGIHTYLMLIVTKEEHVINVKDLRN